MNTRATSRMETWETRNAPSTLDTTARTVEVTWSTGATVARHSWSRGRYDEEVVLSGADLDRLNKGAPVLTDHGASIDRQVGRVVRAWIEGAEGRAVLQFSPEGTSELADRVWAQVAAGIVCNVSAGYLVERYDIVERDGMVPLYRAVNWTPVELSLVAVPADAGAQTRSSQAVQATQFVHVRDDRSLRLRLLQLGR